MKAKLAAIWGMVGTFSLLALAVASGGQYAIATIEHNWRGQLWALASGSTFLCWGVVRIVAYFTDRGNT